MKKNTASAIITNFTKNSKLGGSIYNIYFYNFIFIVTCIIGTLSCWNTNSTIIIKIICTIYILYIIVFMSKRILFYSINKHKYQDLEILKNLLANNYINIINQKEILIEIISERITQHKNNSEELWRFASITTVTIPFLLKDIKIIFPSNLQKTIEAIFLIIFAIYCISYIIENINNALKSKMFF